MKYAPSDVERWAAAYQSGRSLSELSREFGVPRETLRHRLHLAGVPVRGRGHACRPLPDDVLTDEWAQTEAGAWFCGMYVTDGHLRVSPRGAPEFALAQKASDADAVHAVARALGLPESAVVLRAQRGYSSAWLKFRHPRLRWVEEFGLGSGHKTGSVRAPDSLRQSRHFWRGCIDGDGYITVASRNDYPYLGLRNESVELLAQFVEFGAAHGVDIRQYQGRAVCYGTNARLLARILYDSSSFALARKATLARRISE